jgi:hydroxymethylbilane synthase
MTHAATIRLGTRGSQLALYQANSVAARLAEAGGPTCDIVVIKTSGDRLQEAPLSAAGGKRLFVKELEDALLDDAIDLAVHSAKDMPAVLPEGLAISAALPREDPLDAVVLPAGAGATPALSDLGALIATLGPSPAIATSSVRRVAQLSRLVHGGTFAPIRGNLDTRLRKLDAGLRGSGERHAALVLAAAGLHRLGLSSRISFTLPASACVPAPGQGIIAVEIRQDDERMAAMLRPLNDSAASAALLAERSLVEALGGGCQTPVGALATARNAETLEVVAIVIALNGSREVRAVVRGPVDAAVDLGRRAAGDLLARGAREILDEARQQQADVSATTPSP